MKKKVDQLTRNEYRELVTNKRLIKQEKYKDALRKRGKELKQNCPRLRALMRMTVLTDEDLENGEITRGVFWEET